MHRFTLLCAALIAILSVGMQRGPGPASEPKLVRLSSGEYIGLIGVCRVIHDGADAINVTLASGSTLHLANADDVKAVRDGLARLAKSCDVHIFHPIDGVTINLVHVTNVWRQEGAFTFWQVDGQGWSVPKLAMFEQVDRTYQAALKSSGLADDFIPMLPHITVNARHVQHISTVDGELRVTLSNKMWPKVEANEADAAKEAIANATRATK